MGPRGLCDAAFCASLAIAHVSESAILPDHWLRPQAFGCLLRRLPSQESDAVEKDERGADVPDEWLGCARCLNLLDEIRAENLPVPPDAHNAVMRACSSRVDVVQFLFGDLIKAGKETEASFAAMMQAQLNCGDLDGAKETLQGLLSRPRLRTKLRTCGPLITRLCEVGDDSRTTVGLWERLEMRGVGFTQREYSARLGMHARAGEVNLLQSTLNELLDLSPTPDIETLAAIEASVNEIARNGGGALQMPSPRRKMRPAPWGTPD